MNIFGVVISEHDLYLMLSANIMGFVFGVWAEKITTKGKLNEDKRKI